MFIKLREKTAFVWKNDKISYRELLQHIDFYSKLLNPSIEKVAIFSNNRPEWAYAFFGIWVNKSIAVPIDYLSKPEEVAYILNDCKPEVLFISNDQRKEVDEVLPMLSYNIKIISLDDQNYNVKDFNPNEVPVPDIDNTAVIIYTSGTTGSPKGVMLSYDNLLANIEAVTKYVNIYTEDRNVLNLLPMHHILPLLGTLIMPLSVGGTIAFSPTMVSEDIISTLQNNNVAIMVGVPRLYEAIRKGVVDKINKSFAAKTLFKLAKKVNSQSFSKKIFKKVHEKFGGNLTYMVSGGAKLNEEVAKDFKALGFEMLEGYGMTEAAPMISFTKPGRWIIGSAGEIVDTLEVKTTADGEIIARGRNIMKGYYNKPEATSEVIKDGWLYTGDLGLVKDKYIYITGRTKEIIVLSNGKKFNPEEIEFKLRETSELISEVAIFAAQDEKLSAVIFPNFKKVKDDSIINLEEKIRWDVIDQYNKSAANYKKITKFYLTREELPKTRLGKIQRFKLNSLINDSKKNKKVKEEPQFQEYIVIRDYLKEQKQSEVAPDDHLEIDLSLDSLDKVNFQVFLESTFGIKLSEDIFTNNPTVEKLSLYMKEKKNKFHVETVKWAEIFKERVDLKLPKSWFTQNLFKNTSKVFFNLYFRIKGEGIENLPKEGPFIIAPNHQSFFDGLFVSMYLKGKIFKDTYFYAKEKHVKGAFLKALANRNNVIVMDINKDLKESLQKLAEVLKKGKNIIIFPEGSRSYSDSLGEFKKFFAILSLEFNVPIVPVSIKGANKALPKGKILPRFGKKIKVKFLPPIYPDGYDYDTLTKTVYNKLSEELA